MSSIRRGELFVRRRHGDGRKWSPDRELCTVLPNIMREVFYEVEPAIEFGNPHCLLAYEFECKEAAKRMMSAAQLYAGILAAGSRGIYDDYPSSLLSCPSVTLDVVSVLFTKRIMSFWYDMYFYGLIVSERDPNQRRLSELAATVARAQISLLPSKRNDVDMAVSIFSESALEQISPDRDISSFNPKAATAALWLSCSRALCAPRLGSFLSNLAAALISRTKDFDVRAAADAAFVVDDDIAAVRSGRKFARSLLAVYMASFLYCAPAVMNASADRSNDRDTLGLLNDLVTKVCNE